MVIDASTRPQQHEAVAATPLQRDQVIGTPLAQRAFDVVDAIWLVDARIGEVSGRAG
jgi:hypothetical protein